MMRRDAEKEADKSVWSVVVVAIITAACLMGDSMLYIVIVLPTHWQEAGLDSIAIDQ